MPFASRAMLVKQGITVYKGRVGRGQLNAAYGGLGNLCGIVAPLLWGSLYRFFLQWSERGGAAARYMRGGHFFVTAALMLVACLALRTADGTTLFIGDEADLPIAPAQAAPNLDKRTTNNSTTSNANSADATEAQGK